MAANDELLALSDELEAVSLKDDCESCLASGTGLCRGDVECAESAHKACAKRLREIVERDECEVTTVSAYDLLPDEDREALAWVREHGGLEAVKASVHQGAMEHGYLLKIAEMLGTSIYDGSDNADALLEKLSERLMPEGMEWPRFEDGEPVRPSDKLLDKDGDWFEAVSFVFTCDWWSIRGYQTEGFGDLNDKTRRTLEGMSYGARVKRPAPKVLDADGVEIRAGDTVWVVGDAWPSMKVLEIKPDDDPDVPEHLVWCGEMCCEPLSDTKKWRIANQFTHRAPVLAADGEPLEVGQTVWHVGNGVEFTVIGLPWSGEYQAVKLRLDDGAVTGLDPDQLTHERPESWERLEEDAKKGSCDYFGCDADGCHGCPAYGWNMARGGNGCGNAKALDLVRRARKLAERGGR